MQVQRCATAWHFTVPPGACARCSGPAMPHAPCRMPHAPGPTCRMPSMPAACDSRHGASSPPRDTAVGDQDTQHSSKVSRGCRGGPVTNLRMEAGGWFDTACAEHLHCCFQHHFFACMRVCVFAHTLLAFSATHTRVRGSPARFLTSFQASSSAVASARCSSRSKRSPSWNHCR